MLQVSRRLLPASVARLFNGRRFLACLVVDECGTVVPQTAVADTFCGHDHAKYKKN